MAVKLTNVEKHAIQNMSREGITTEAIAKDIKKSAKLVQAHIDETNAAIARLEEERRKNTPPPVPLNITASDLMIHETGAKKNKCVAVMTAAASAKCDETQITVNEKGEQVFVNKPHIPVKSRTAKGAMFNIKENKIE